MSPEAKELTLTEKANAAFRQAMIAVLEVARRTGTPVIVWENGKVTEKSPDELAPLLDLPPDEKTETQT